MKLKRIVTGVVAVAVAVVVAGYAIIASLEVQKVASFAATEVKAATGRDLVIDGPVDLKISLNPSINLEDVRFANAPWGSRPDMITLRRLEIQVELLPLLTGDVVVRHVVLIKPDVLLETDAEGRNNWDFAAESGPAAPAPSADAGADGMKLPDVRDIHVEGGVLQLVDAAAGETLRLDLTEAIGGVPKGGGPRPLRLAAAYNGNPFVIEGSYGGLQVLLSGAAEPLDLTISAGGATVTAKGTAGNLIGAMTADLAVTAAGDDLSGLSPWVAGEVPAVGPYNLSAKLKIAGQSIDISGLALKVGSSDLTGNVSLSRAGDRPLVKAALVSKLLDLGDFTAGQSASGGGGTAGAGGGTGRVFPDDPLPLEILRAVDAQVKLDAERLRVEPMTLEEVQASTTLKAGTLTVDPLTAKLAGGNLSGRLAVAASKAEPDVTLRLDGKKVDFGALLRQAAVTDEVGGAMDLEIDLKGRGASPHAIAAGLGGHVQAVALDGTIDNSLLRVMSVGLGDIVGPLFGKTDRTRLECLVARFDITGGQAESRALVLDTGAFAVAGRGGIDLGKEQVHLAFDTQTSEPSLASLALPFRVTGPLADPAVTPDPIGAAVGVVGTVGDVAATGGNIVGGAVDTVGGLIGTGPIIGHIGSDQTLCGEALAAIGQGAPAGASSSGGSSGGVADDVGKALKGAGESIEKGIKSLFGN